MAVHSLCRASSSSSAHLLVVGLLSELHLLFLQLIANANRVDDSAEQNLCVVCMERRKEVRYKLLRSCAHNDIAGCFHAVCASVRMCGVCRTFGELSHVSYRYNQNACVSITIWVHNCSISHLLGRTPTQSLISELNSPIAFLSPDHELKPSLANILNLGALDSRCSRLAVL